MDGSRVTDRPRIHEQERRLGVRGTAVGARQPGVHPLPGGLLRISLRPPQERL